MTSKSKRSPAFQPSRRRPPNRKPEKTAKWLSGDAMALLESGVLRGCPPALVAVYQNLLVWIFLRGFCIVTLVAWNVRHVSELQYGAAFVTGGLVSLVWFSNARTASLTTSNLGKWCYSAGAACGTVFGMWLGS